MKRIVILLFLLVFLVGCGHADSQKRVYYHCPYCDEPIDHEPDPEYLFSWLEREGYTVIYEDDLQEFAWSFFIDNPDQFSDFMNDYAEDYLRDQGWAITPPRSANSSNNASNNTIVKNQSATVYWVSGGKVYHSTDKCYHIAGKSNIHSGTIEEAKAANKSRMCADCGGS